MKKLFVSTGIFLSLTIAVITSGCGGKTSVKGSDLKGEDAKAYLTGDEKRCWKLENGHDYYQSLLFTKAGKVTHHKGTEMNFMVSGSTLTMKDFQDFVYTILEIGNDKMTLMLPGKDTLVYTNCDEEMKKDGKMPSKDVDTKWIKGKYGTTWKFVDGGKMYSFMNDGTILDATTLTKIDTWSISGTTLNFGSNQLAIKRLEPIFFDYDVYGMVVQLNYISEAKKDGSPVRTY